MTKYTQGKWRKIYHAQTGYPPNTTDRCFYEIRSRSDKLIAKLPGWTEEDEANAALIEAAPNLLTAIEAVLPYAITGIEELRRFGPNFLKDVCDGKAAIEAADAVIREAIP